MRKKVLILTLSVLLALVFTGCSSSAASTTEARTEGTVAADMKTQDNSLAGEPNVAPAETQSTGSENPGGTGINPGKISNSNLKIIYTVMMSLEAKDASKAVRSLSDKAASLGGYVSDSNFQKNATYSTASVTLRIPPDSLKELTEAVGKEGKILSSNMTSDDVSQQYVDLESRLKNAESQEAQLLIIMEQATKISDILSVREELNGVQEEIETLKGELRYLDDMVGYSTVTVTITEPVPEPEAPEADPNEGLLALWSPEFIGANMQKAFSNSLAVVSMVFGAILMLISFLLIPALIIGVIVFAIVKIVKFAKRKKVKKP